MACDDTTAASCRFSLVVLCYLEGQTLIQVVRNLHHTLSRYPHPWEIVLVANYFDGQMDPTPQIAQDLAASLPGVRCISVPKKGMMGWDMRTGIASTQGDFVGVMDGDGQFAPEVILTCLDTIERTSLDIVKARRSVRYDGLHRRVQSTIYNQIFRTFFGGTVSDINAKPKIIRRTALNKLALESDDWFIDAEIIIKAIQQGMYIGEIPMEFHENTARHSMIGISTIAEFAVNLIRYRLGRRS